MSVLHMNTTGIDPAAVIVREQAALMHTYARLPLVLVDGEGCTVRDAEGREFLDLVAGIAVSNLGHKHPALVSAAKLAAEGVWHVSNLYHSLPHIELAEGLCAAGGFERAFFCNSGAESLEAAIKLARKLGGEARRTIVAAEQSFHGRTTGALAATGQPKYRTAFEPLMPAVTHVPFGDVAALEAAINEGTAGLILEAIQGEGGVRPAPDGYLKTARELCNQAGALLIIDEVQTGLGRTGSMFAFQQHGIEPDVICLAKALAGGLPMGAILTRGRAATGFVPGDHASTFGGGLFVASVALAMLRELKRPGLLEHVNEMGALCRERLGKLATGLPGVVEARGAGLMWGLELATPTAGDVVKRLFDHGIISITAGPSVLRLVPPLIITREQMTRALDAIDTVVREVAG